MMSRYSNHLEQFSILVDRIKPHFFNLKIAQNQRACIIISHTMKNAVLFTSNLYKSKQYKKSRTYQINFFDKFSF